MNTFLAFAAALGVAWTLALMLTPVLSRAATSNAGDFLFRHSRYCATASFLIFAFLFARIIWNDELSDAESVAGILLLLFGLVAAVWATKLLVGARSVELVSGEKGVPNRVALLRQPGIKSFRKF